MPNFLPASYTGGYGYSGVGQQVYPQYPQMSQMGAAGAMGSAVQSQNSEGLKWVDGEVGAKAYQLPAGLRPNEPVALWDTNDTVIYLKSVNPMGMPNPLQKARYVLEGTKSGEASQAFSGDAREPEDMTKFVRKDDLERMKQELLETIQGMNVSQAARRTSSSKGE